MDHLLIVGTGALATLFAARLAQAGHSITMLGTWPEGLKALRDRGACLVDAGGNEQRFEVRAVSDPAECREVKHALVLVKAWQTARAAGQLEQCLAADGLAVTLQNGLGNYEILSRALDRSAGTNGEGNSKSSVLSVAKRFSRVVLGITTTGATLLSPGRVRAGGEGIISLERHPAIAPLEAALRSAKFQVQIVDDAQSLVWGKLVVNAAINPLTALLRLPNGELLKRASARELMGLLAVETARVAAAEGIHLPFADPVAAVEDVAAKTAVNHSSMLQDVLRGAPTEIDAICGAIVQAARRHDLATPANLACWKLVKALGE